MRNGNSGADLNKFCSLCYRSLSDGMHLSKVRGVWRLQAPQCWQTYIRTCSAIAPTPVTPLPPPPARPRKPVLNIRSSLKRNHGAASASATASAPAARAPASATPIQIVRPAVGATTLTSSVEMVSLPASQLPAHYAAADLAIALNEQWMWHGTSYPVRYIHAINVCSGAICSTGIALLNLMPWECLMPGTIFASEHLKQPDAQASLLAGWVVSSVREHGVMSFD